MWVTGWVVPILQVFRNRQDIFHLCCSVWGVEGWLCWRSLYKCCLLGWLCSGLCVNSRIALSLCLSWQQGCDAIWAVENISIKFNFSLSLAGQHSISAGSAGPPLPFLLLSCVHPCAAMELPGVRWHSPGIWWQKFQLFPLQTDNDAFTTLCSFSPWCLLKGVNNLDFLWSLEGEWLLQQPWNDRSASAKSAAAW